MSSWGVMILENTIGRWLFRFLFLPPLNSKTLYISYITYLLIFFFLPWQTFQYCYFISLPPLAPLKPTTNTYFSYFSYSINFFFLGSFQLVLFNISPHHQIPISYISYSIQFYPSKGSAKALPMGSNWFSYGLLSLVNEKWSFNFAMVIRQKIPAKNLCADGTD